MCSTPSSVSLFVPLKFKCVSLVKKREIYAAEISVILIALTSDNSFKVGMFSQMYDTPASETLWHFAKLNRSNSWKRGFSEILFKKLSLVSHNASFELQSNGFYSGLIVCLIKQNLCGFIPLLTNKAACKCVFQTT